jgi:hypothetical protein
METVDLNRQDAAARKAEMASHFDATELDRVHEEIVQAYTNERRTTSSSKEPGQQEVSAWSVEQMEAHRASLDGIVNAAKPPTGMHPQDLYFAREDYQKAESTLRPRIVDIDLILARVRRRVWDFLVRTEQQLAYGAVASSVFERYRQYVDRQLRDVAPEALDQLRAAYARAAEGPAEARAQAVLSCRRVLKSVADVLYPASSTPIRAADGTERQVTDEHWVNRLWQFVADRSGQSRFRQATRVNLAETGKRIDALNDLTSKGLHEQASEYEMDQAIIQTYVLIGDLLRLREETAPPSA